MTEVQKSNVLLLRQEGLSYRDISEELRLPLGTVKTFCRNLGLMSNDAYEDTGNEDIKETTNNNHCHECGKPLEQRPKAKRRRFCNDACRHRWWNAHRNRVSKKTAVRTVCACCGLMFDSYAYQRRKYCSHACYIKGRYGGGAA